jgi:hypothetical protein
MPSSLERSLPCLISGAAAYLGGCFPAPVIVLIPDHGWKGRRRQYKLVVDPVLASLDHTHSDVGILGQSSCDNQASCTTPDDNVVVLLGDKLFNATYCGFCRTVGMRGGPVGAGIVHRDEEGLCPQDSDLEDRGGIIWLKNGSRQSRA